MTRYARAVHEPVSATRPQQSPATSATELAHWLSATAEVAVHGDLDVAVSGISLSTARVRPGDVYRGTLSMFEHAGFEVVARRRANRTSPERPIVRRALG